MTKRDQMLIRAGRWCGQLEADNNIYPSLILENHDEVSEFIADAVADYIMSNSTENFDCYIVEALREEFGTITSEEAKEREKQLSEKLNKEIDV